MGAFLEILPLDMEGLRGRVATAGADGRVAWIRLLTDRHGAAGSPVSMADLAGSLTGPKPCAVVELDRDSDAAEASERLEDFIAGHRDQGIVAALLIGSEAPETGPPGFQPLALTHFDTPDAMFAILGAGARAADGTAETGSASAPKTSPTTKRRKIRWGSTQAAALHRSREGTWQAERDRARRSADDPGGRRVTGLLAAAFLVLIGAAGFLAWRHGDDLVADTSARVGDAFTTDASKKAPGIAAASRSDAFLPVEDLTDAKTLYARRAFRLRAEPEAGALVSAFIAAGEAVTVLGSPDPGGWTRVAAADGATGHAFTALLSRRQVMTGRQSSLIRLKDCAACPTLILLPPLSGPVGTEPERRPPGEHDLPLRLVHLTQARLAGETEVTRDQWAACVDAGACRRPAAGPVSGGEAGNLPVTGVTWEDTQRYAAWLGSLTGRTYRLPSEVEWEVAARAGSPSAFHFGDRISPVQARFDAAQETPFNVMGRSPAGPSRVDKHPKNSLGLRDMHGNVAEWTADCWDRICDQRVIRGGSWMSAATAIRSAARGPRVSESADPTIGFRVFRDL
ncbi:MAG: SUMF1/EgtB/PvdO family nonheme iron enzyme [Alphaproteobacteria bacterium]